MEYRLKRTQIFRKKVKAPGIVLKGIYDNRLKLEDFFKYDLVGKVPITCLDKQGQAIIKKFGLAKARTLDMGIFYESFIIGNSVITGFDYLMELDSDIPNLKEALYADIKAKVKNEHLPNKVKNYYAEELKDAISSSDFTEEMKKMYPEYVAEEADGIDSYLCHCFNNGTLTMEEIIENWDSLKNKNLGFYLKKYSSEKNITIDDAMLRKVMEEYADLIDVVKSTNKITEDITDLVINLANNPEESREYLKKIISKACGEKIVSNTLSEKEIEVISKYASLVDCLEEYYPSLKKHESLKKEFTSMSFSYLKKNNIVLDKIFSSWDQDHVCACLDKIGIKNVIAFNKENSDFLDGDFLCTRLYYVDYAYIKDEIQSLDELYDFIREVAIVRSIPGWTFELNISGISGEFKRRNPDLYIDEQAPEELKVAFNLGEITAKMLLEHPEYISFLEGKNLKYCLYHNLRDLVPKQCDEKEFLEVISEYGDVLSFYDYDRGRDVETIDDVIEIINSEKRRNILLYSTSYPEHFPEKLRKEYPELYIDEKVPYELKDAIYRKTLTPEIFDKNREYIDYLSNVDTELLYNAITKDISISWGSFVEKINDVEKKYGNQTEYMSFCYHVFYEKIKKNKEYYNEDMPENFKKMYPDLFLAEDAPSELKSAFYNKNITIDTIINHPEYLVYLKNVDLELLNLDRSLPSGKDGESLIQKMKILFKDEALDVLSDYAKYLKLIQRKKIDSSIATKDELLDEIDKMLYEFITEEDLPGSRCFTYDENMPEHFKKNYPSLFLSEDAPVTLKNAFYSKKITIDMLKDNPEYIEYLRHVDLRQLNLEMGIFKNDDGSRVGFVDKIQELFKEEAIDILFGYGKYFEDHHHNYDTITFDQKIETKEDLLEAIEKKVYEKIISDERMSYDENMPEHFKKTYPSLFLPGDAPKELQDAFYSGHAIELLVTHPEYADYLRHVDLEILYNYMPINNQYGENVVSIIKRVFKEDAFDFMLGYGPYLERIVTKFDGYDFLTIKKDITTRDELLSEIEKVIYESILSEVAWDKELFTGKHGYSYFYDENMPKHFKETYPSLFISEEAPIELKDAFYSGKVDYTYILAHPEYIDYLRHIDLELFCGYIPIGDCDGENLVSKIKKVFKEEGLDIILTYGSYLDKYGNNYATIKPYETREEVLSEVKKIVYKTIISHENVVYNENTPEDFKETYPALFLSDDAPEELKEAVYNRKITIEIILEHPEYIDYLQNIDLHLICHFNGKLVDKIKDVFAEDSFYMVLAYGKYLDRVKYIKIDEEIDSKEKLLTLIEQKIYEGIIGEDHIIYDEQLPTSFKDKYPTLFIDENAPEELKEAFYSKEITQEMILEHPEYIEYLKQVELEVLYKYMPINDDENVVSKVKKVFKEDSFDFMLKYGKYLERMFDYYEEKNPHDKYNVEFSYAIVRVTEKEEFLKEIDTLIYESILRGEIKYDDKIDESFIKKHPELFLGEDVPREIKEKFYNREITLGDFIENPDLLDIIGDINIAYGISTDCIWLVDLFKEEKNSSKANLKRLKVFACFESIKDDKLKEDFKEYLDGHGDELTIEQIEDTAKLLKRIAESNSTELYNFRSEVVGQLLQTDDPHGNLDSLERIFVKNNIPMFAKIYQCFRILYPEFSKKENDEEVFDFSSTSRMSPELIKASPQSKELKKLKRNMSDTEMRFQIIYNDLVRIALFSNDYSFREYVNNIEEGNDIYLDLVRNNKDVDSLSDEEKEILTIFVSHLEVIYEKSKVSSGKDISLDGLSLKEKISILSKAFDVTIRYGLPDRIVRDFAFFSGIDSFEKLKTFMQANVQITDARNRMRAEELKKQPLQLHKGDFIRCIGAICKDTDPFGSSLTHGNICNEYLGPITGRSKSDTTPLDIDWTQIDKETDIYHTIKGSPSGFNLGNIYIVMRRENQNLVVTRNNEDGTLDTEYDPRKIEMFTTSVNGKGFETHWGARTGIAATDIDYIVYKKQFIIDDQHPYNADGCVNYVSSEIDGVDDLDIIKFDIVKNGIYIPVVDFNGKLIFTPEEYDYMRSKMAGLSHYGQTEFPLDHDSLIFPGIEEVIRDIADDKEAQEQKKIIIGKMIEKVIKSDTLGLGVREIKGRITGDLSDEVAELLGTGSTARGTNVPDDGDYDYMLKLGRSLVKAKEAEIIKALKKIFGISDKQDNSHGNRFRGKDISIEGIEGDVEIDISVDQKRNGCDYSTEMALSDRLEAIKKQHPDDYPLVIANIVYAKMILKEAKCYKARKSDIHQGGLGGIGVENWILQNGGSLTRACEDFLSHALNPDGSMKKFEEFKKEYKIWDFGSNHEPRDKKLTTGGEITFPHDEFISDNMTAEGYEKTVSVLQKFLKQKNMQQEERSVKK